MEGLERLAIAQTPLSTSATHADRADELLEASGVAVVDGAACCGAETTPMRPSIRIS